MVVDGVSREECELTILMPCLNEAETLARCVEKAAAFLKETGISGEILVADNGSTDGSPDIARKQGARVIDVPARGYGAALGAGIIAAKGRYVIMGDSDDSYDFSRLSPFMEKLRQGYDLVMGNRFKGGIAKGAMPFLHRYLGNPVLTALGKLFFGGPVGDFHCGLRGFNRKAILQLDLQTPGMEFASEMVVKAVLHGLKITEVPTTLSPDGRSRPPHLRTWQDGWRHLVFMLLHAPLWLFFLPGLLFLSLGILLILMLLPGPLSIGFAVIDAHTMVVASGMVNVGAMMLMFWFLARQYAVFSGVLPETPGHRKVMKLVTLERSLVCGGLSCLAGLSGIVAAFVHWGNLHFGELNYQVTLRQVIPAMTLIVFGLQVVFFGFLSSLLRLGLKQKQQ